MSKTSAATEAPGPVCTSHWAGRRKWAGAGERRRRRGRWPCRGGRRGRPRRRGSRAWSRRRGGGPPPGATPGPSAGSSRCLHHFGIAEILVKACSLTVRAKGGKCGEVAFEGHDPGRLLLNIILLGFGKEEQKRTCWMHRRPLPSRMAASRSRRTRPGPTRRLGLSTSAISRHPPLATVERRAATCLGQVSGLGARWALRLPVFLPRRCRQGGLGPSHPA